MNYKNDSIALIEEAKNSLLEIRQSYEESLHEKEVKSKLLIKIKNFMENLRSALDFSSHYLFDKYCNSTISNPKIYFPYAWKELDLAEFRRKNLVENKIQGLSSNRPDIVTIIEGFQHFSDKENSWLPKFMDLNNENKHQRLTPQTRTEDKELNINFDNGRTAISLSEGSIFHLAEGSIMEIGDSIIRGEQTFSAENPPIIENGNAQIITWVSFEFTDLNEPVIPFLEKALVGCNNIVTKLTSF